MTHLLHLTLSAMLIAPLLACGGADTSLPDLPVAQTGLPEAEGLSAWRRAAVDAVVDGRVWMGARSGFVVLVARDGQLIHAHTTGLRDLEAGLPMAMDTRFQIASMTKPIIATAAMILVEEGRIGLDDPVSDHIPEMAGMEVAVLDEAGEVTETIPQVSPMTVRNVLSFASGIGPGFESGPLTDRWRAEGPYTGEGSLAERVLRIPPLPLFEQPGTKWRYGSAYDVLARIVEVGAGEPLEVFLERRIFEPLGMHATHYLKDTPDDAPLAKMYTRGEDGLVLAAQRHRPDDWTPGGTGLVSTAPDYMRFALMLWNEGEYDGVRILSRESLQRMRQPEIPGVLGTMGMGGLSFGLGVSVVTDEEETPMATRDGDFWWSGAYGTHFWVSPSTGIVLVVLQQQAMNPESDAPIAPFVVQQFVLTD